MSLLRAVCLRALVGVLLSASPGYAAEEQTACTAALEDVQARVAELERQVQALQSALRIAVPLPGNGAVGQQQAAASVGGDSAATPASVEAAPPPAPTASTPAASFRIYGMLLNNTYYDSAGASVADVPLYAFSPADGRSRDRTFSFSPRQTRFGFDIREPIGSGERAGTIKLLVESDFFGGFPGSGIDTSFPDLRLRLAYARFDFERTTLLIGQDWTFFNDQNPVHFQTTVGPFVASGNPAIRYPQIRLDRRLTQGDGGGLVAQIGILRPVSPELPEFGTTNVLVGPGERAARPFVEGRLAWSGRSFRPSDRVVGVSFHAGREDFRDFGHVPTQAIGLEFKLPLLERASLAGEVFRGRNINALFGGGVFQGVTIRDGLARAIETAGGWSQLTVNLRPNLDLTAAYGLDDPFDRTLSRAGDRSRNSTLLVSLIERNLFGNTIALELSRIGTDYVLQPTGRVLAFNFAFQRQFSFTH